MNTVPSHFSLYHFSKSARLTRTSTTIAVIYAHTAYPDSHTFALSLLQSALDTLIANIPESPKPEVLWSLHYDQRQNPPTTSVDYNNNIKCAKTSYPHVQQLPDVDPGLVLEDDVLKHVRAAWRKIVGEDEEFLNFGERDGMGEEDGDGDGEV